LPRGALVLTTIYDNPVLETYWQNLSKYHHLDSLEVFLIPDRKTPAAVYASCRELKQRGMRLKCPSLEEQEDFLTTVGLEPAFVPYDSDNRRNVGYLMGLAAGVDFLISIDDDNYCLDEEDFFAAHALICGEAQETEVVATESGWFNICSLLQFDQAGPVYPRGFPYFARHRREDPTRRLAPKSIHFNAGLWLQSPDIDGISWLVNPVIAQSFRGPSLVLDNNIWSPINTQNTALRAEVVPAFYYLRMNYPLLGWLPIDRYGDIFAGYFAQACMHHLGGSLRIGTPVAEHRRHSHNFLKDALQEMACLALMEDLLPWLTREAKLEGATYAESYVCLSALLEDAVERFGGNLWTGASRGYFHQVANFMRQWASCCTALLGS
jgi:hypothetical protein